MSEANSPNADPAPRSAESAAAPESVSLPVTQADILTTESTADEVLAGAVIETTVSPEAVEAAAGSGVSLELGDILAATDGTDPNLGAYLKVETVNGNTVVSVDPDGAGGAPAVMVVTLEGVTGLTLQQLLQHDPTIT